MPKKSRRPDLDAYLPESRKAFDSRETTERTDGWLSLVVAVNDDDDGDEKGGTTVTAAPPNKARNSNERQ